MRTAKDWIEQLGLEPHPEGGWFREVYRAGETIARAGLPDRFSGARCFSTAIYFLLESGQFSALHRLRQDEVFHFYDGSPLAIHSIGTDGEYSTAVLGRDPAAGQSLVRVIPAGTIFGAAVEQPGSYALVGCTVAPGFEYADFEMPGRGALLAQFPQHADVIRRLTR